MKFRNLVLILLLAFVSTIVGCGGNSGTQLEDDGNIYYYSGGNKVAGWVNCDDGVIRYFDNNDFHAVKGWQTIDGKTYYFDENTGAIVKSGWSSDGYYLIADGSVATGNGNGYAATVSMNSNDYDVDMEELPIGSNVSFNFFKKNTVDTENVKYQLIESNGAISDSVYEWHGGNVFSVTIDNYSILGELKVKVFDTKENVLIEKKVRITNKTNDVTNNTINENDSIEANSNSDILQKNNVELLVGQLIKKDVEGYDRQYEIVVPIVNNNNEMYRVSGIIKTSQGNGITGQSGDEKAVKAKGKANLHFWIFKDESFEIELVDAMPTTKDEILKEGKSWRLRYPNLGNYIDDYIK